MKIVFDEHEINAALVGLNQLKVEGFEQAGLLVAISNVLKKGERLEDAEKKKGE